MGTETQFLKRDNKHMRHEHGAWPELGSSLLATTPRVVGNILVPQHDNSGHWNGHQCEIGLYH